MATPATANPTALATRESGIRDRKTVRGSANSIGTAQAITILRANLPAFLAAALAARPFVNLSLISVAGLQACANREEG